ncbi:MAG: alpha-L-fucosidase [Phycisphaerae bacterium]|nr:alpha-L-fucosidase [Phycisphaerae bacterium]
MFGRGPVMKEIASMLSIVVLMTFLGNVPVNGGEDENPFAGESLPDGWAWKRPNPEAWRLRDGGLEIQIGPGNMWGGTNDARNVLLIPVAGDLLESGTDVQVTLANSPTRRWEQVDLVWYYRDSHMVKIGLELEHGKNSVVMGREEDDRTRTIGIIPIEKDEVTVRLRVTGGQVRGYYRLAPEDPWTDVGTCEAPRPIGGNDRAQVSIQCYQGDPQNPHWARITGLRIDSASEVRAQSNERMQWWRESRFGMFVHWGPVSLRGTEIGWSRGKEVAIEEYDQLYKQFNPTKFDAEEWVRVAKDAGMKYLVITSKHHDGFCLWSSKYTDYHIGNTPFNRDVLKELSEACRENGIQFCTYHSICDWRHPDYPLGSPGGSTAKPTHDMPRYYQYLKNQTKEIIDNYGPLGIMWFDGEWEKPWTREHGNELYEYLLEVQPTLIINNRVSKGRQGMAGTTEESHLNSGDYDTPEQQIGGFNRDRPWETCMTICQQWAWKPDDQMKSAKECIQTLVRTAGGDGNLLFNVGPMPDGRIEPRQVERLKEMGSWLQEYGDGIYATRGGPFKPGKWGASTCKDDKVYLHVMNWRADGRLMLPGVGRKIVSCRAHDGGEMLLKQNEDAIEIHLESSERNEIAVVIELTVDGMAFTIDPVEVADPTI